MKVGGTGIISSDAGAAGGASEPCLRGRRGGRTGQGKKAAGEQPLMMVLTDRGGRGCGLDLHHEVQAGLAKGLADLCGPQEVVLGGAVSDAAETAAAAAAAACGAM